MFASSSLENEPSQIRVICNGGGGAPALVLEFICKLPLIGEDSRGIQHSEANRCCLQNANHVFIVEVCI
ncbi:hypothetical protein IGI04_027449 [Brassica rapa subsp. trilocularis]|uniref:Uncharacterized protein n=1 Tax=Brassica rapa subsp. trilocularis TaxID=1813537 RepID=A0ABQ7KZ73_BRACM|nr:hypothetical protein IGI04_027449 [Brassica rapa subsp. trilocularis]